MISLKTENYYKLAEPLKNVGINHLFARTVVEQKMDGEVFVDDPDQPSTFYVKHSYGMSLLFGNTFNDNFNKQLTSYLLNESNNRQTGEWLQVYPSEWNDRLGKLLNEKITGPEKSDQEKPQIIKWSRVNFKFNPDKYASRKSSIPDGFKLTRTDAQLFDRISGAVVPSFFWRNRDEFAENAIGFSLIYGDEPISTAFASFIHDNQLELGIETKAEFQGKGLARITCSALIDYCLANGFEPIWSCRLENTGSFKLAQKLGFEPTLIVPYYQLPAQSSRQSEFTMKDIFISTDRERLDVEMIHSFLSERSYWAKGRSMETVRQTIAHSLCFGIYNQEGKQLGFARVATDYAVFGWLMDVFIMEEYRGLGLGKLLIKHVVEHPVVENLRRVGLGTSDAHGLYSQFGFSPPSAPEKIMERLRT